MDLESVSPSRKPRLQCLKAYRASLLLAYQSFGVVYGDLSISPIYVYKNTFSGRLRLHEEDAEVLGVLSIVFWTLTLIAVFKYIIFMLGADDNGEGGTFALYSLMCRNSKMGFLSIPEAANQQLSASNEENRNEETNTSLMIKKFFERHWTSRLGVLLFVLLGTSMVIGDGVLTPTMSVLAAVSGIRTKFPELHEKYTVFIACVILTALFALQRCGTRRVGFLFAPISIAWLGCISIIGVYNVAKWNPGVLRALSPYYIYNFFKKSGKDGWSSLGGLVLCITGTEAMFADLGHFSKISIRMAFTTVVYPCLLLAYMGEAAYLSKHKEDLQQSFFKAIPEHVFWPVFVIATSATAVASQAIISATFSLISQCRALGCFPRIKVVHTSSHIHGQVYIPEVNWLLMLLCLCVTIGFRDIEMIGNAYGLSVVTVMFVTTCLMFLVITTVWKQSILIAFLFVATFGSLELLYLSSCLSKFFHGGWLPLVFSLTILCVMLTWHYGTSKKRAFELENKVSIDQLLSMSNKLGLVRIPGISVAYSNIMMGVPPMFAHFVTNFPVSHRVVIFVCRQTVQVPRVGLDERFLIARIGKSEYSFFQCTVRHGYKDGGLDNYEFENQLFRKLDEFINQEDRDPTRNFDPMRVTDDTSNLITDASGRSKSVKRVQFTGVQERRGVRQEVVELMKERDAGVSYMLGQTNVVAHESSSCLKKLAIHVYSFLRRNSRSAAVALGIPHTSLIEVGMVYRV